MNKMSIVGILVCLAACDKRHNIHPMIPIKIPVEITTTPTSIPQLQGVIIDLKNEPEHSKCHSGMNLIKGNYCPNPKHECLEWLDNPNGPAPRCQRYKSPTVCQGGTISMEYCMDVEELHDSSGMPYGDLSWNSAKAMCEKDGKRLCSKEEWTFAAAGPNNHPFTYGAGYNRDYVTCNVGRKPATCGSKLCDYRSNITEYPNCVSTMGIHNMTGSVDEWISVPYYSHSQYPGMRMRSILMGGHTLHGRQTSYNYTQNHGEDFTNPPTIGSRCCSSIN